ncbi:MAG TPA: transcription elongation factor GreA [Candidatus Mcinerneyibacteriales bacterium]|nr:transcription elongation factor GreA [Candidatus Mcinerneyibacteriales bacterium]
MKEVHISKEKYQELAEELDRLKKVERPAIIKAIQEARALGDLSENAEYATAKDKQGLIETRISELQERLQYARLYDESKFRDDVVVVGARVRLVDLTTEEEMSYVIVGSDDADYSANKISDESPIGSVLIGKKIGDKVLVRAPEGSQKLQVVGIEKGI